MRGLTIDPKSTLERNRAVFNEMNKRFTTFPFTLRALEDEKTARLGVQELLNHELVHPYPVRVLSCALCVRVLRHCMDGFSVA